LLQELTGGEEMGLISFLKDKENLEEYKRLRVAGRGLSLRIIEKLPKPAVQECAKKLGLLKGKTLVLGSEDELSVLFDYCLYNYRKGGKTAIQRFMEESPPPPDSEQRLSLEWPSREGCCRGRITT
jgi:hypothetical protein